MAPTPTRVVPPEPRASRARLRAAGWVGFALCGVVAFARALLAHTPPADTQLAVPERAAVGRAAAAAEPRWRTDALHRFPGDSWSQDDDVHASERTWALEEARRRGVPVTDVYRAIDEDLRAHPPEAPRKATSSPSKPRPFYD